MIGKQGEVAPVEHAGGKITHDRLSLYYMQVSQHLIRAPAANELDAVSIDISTQKGHGSRRTQGSSGDVLGEEAVGWA